ncbi:MAG: hypothetical protein KAR35_10700 [Candidatus Heimdallarchaeota archaeon]|nr:hypothetical protein [Candidatus Heimdallarchaeota archaeon]MCK5049827.1 hypothetical protein [Candidatus Heimdallarchaeota archaeon]
MPEDSFTKKYMKVLTVKTGERRLYATLLAYSALAILPVTILSLVWGFYLGLIIWGGAVLFANLFIFIPIKLIIAYNSTRNQKEKLLQLNSLLKKEPSTPLSNNSINLLILGFNSQEKDVKLLSIETLELIKEDERVIKALSQNGIQGKSIYERMMWRRTPSPESVWHYLKKVDHMPVKRKGENVQRLSDEI